MNILAIIVLATLWMIWAALLATSEIVVLKGGHSKEFIRRKMRIFSSVTLTFAAWIWLATINPPILHSIALLIALGMTAGLFGDLFLASYFPVKQSFILGMASFALDHIFCCSAFLLLCVMFNINNKILFATWAIWLIIGIISWRFTAYTPNWKNPMQYISLIYCCLLSSTAGISSAIAVQQFRFLPLALGGALFLFSDLLIAVRAFKGINIKHAEKIIWLTYGPAQMLIVYSCLLALVLYLR